LKVESLNIMNENRELWCARKHLYYVLISCVEMIDYFDDFYNEWAEIEKNTNKVIDCILKNEIDVAYESVKDLRRILMKLELEMKDKILKNEGLKIDFRRLISNLYHAEIHLSMSLENKKENILEGIEKI